MALRAGRRYRRTIPRSSPLGILIVLAVALLGAWHVWQEQRGSVSTGPAASDGALVEGIYAIDRVIDGDTLVLHGGLHLRLIGSDTPETVKPNSPVEPWGPEASQFTKQFVSGGKVRLEFDGDRKDRYDRFLAYVWVDDRMLNEELIRAGLARARTGYNYSRAMKTRFERAEREAREAGRGVWSAADAAAGR